MTDVVANVTADVEQIEQTKLLNKKLLSSDLVWHTRRAAKKASRHASEIQKTWGTLSRKEAFLVTESIKIGMAIANAQKWADIWPAVEALQEKRRVQESRLKENSSKGVLVRRETRRSAGRYVEISLVKTWADARSVKAQRGLAG